MKISEYLALGKMGYSKEEIDQIKTEDNEDNLKTQDDTQKQIEALEAQVKDLQSRAQAEAVRETAGTDDSAGIPDNTSGVEEALKTLLSGKEG